MFITVRGGNAPAPREWSPKGEIPGPLVDGRVFGELCHNPW